LIFFLFGISWLPFTLLADFRAVNAFCKLFAYLRHYPAGSLAPVVRFSHSIFLILIILNSYRRLVLMISGAARQADRIALILFRADNA
jgi:hypothetical protein